MAIQGIIRPPPEIRAVADKTASFVAKNGRAFETRILNSAKGKTPKFAFLHESSPFHAYYEDKILFYQNGGVDEEIKGEDVAVKVSEGSEKVSVSKESEETKHETSVKEPKTIVARKVKSTLDPVARVLLTQREKIKDVVESSIKSTAAATEETEEGATLTKEKVSQENHTQGPPTPSFIFTKLVAPRNISPVQLEIVKLTAQFAVLNGKGGPFLRELTIKEWENPIFGFLQPRHGYYAFFAQLIDIYRKILQQSVAALGAESDARKESSNSYKGGPSLLEISNLKKFVGLDPLTGSQNLIDQEVELITKTAGSISNCLDHVAYCAELNRHFEEQRREEDHPNTAIGGAARVDWHDFVIVETIDFPVDEAVESIPPPAPVVDKRSEVATGRNEESMDESDDEHIKVVSDYQPKVVSSQAQFSSEARTHIIDPITGRSIPIEDMTEHMRIQLLDPKWASEKAKFMDSQKDSNLVRSDLVAKNINALVGPSTTTQNPQISSQMPQQRPSKEDLQPVLQQGHSHPKPAITQPDPKRVRADTSLPHLSIPIAVNELDATSNLAAEDHIPISDSNKDTEVLKTTLSEADFVKSLPNRNVKLNITIPRDTSNAAWNLDGQTISLQVDVMTSVKVIKESLQPHLGSMPINKIQLKSPDIGFLKDSLSLAYLNIGHTDAYIEMVPKVRGGRR
jgi:splicing factor 3A subunit 1